MPPWDQHFGSASYRSIASILRPALDKAFLPDTTPDADSHPARQTSVARHYPLTSKQETLSQQPHHELFLAALGSPAWPRPSMISNATGRHRAALRAAPRA